MDKAQLLRLLEQGERSLDELHAIDRPLVESVTDVVRTQLDAEVNARLARASSALRDVVRGVLAGGGRSGASGSLLAAVRECGNEDVVTEAEDRARELRSIERLARRLGSDVPLSDNPALRRHFERARVHGIADFAGIPEASVDKLLERAPSPPGVTDAVLADLVADGVLTEAAARALGLAVSLHAVVDGNTALMRAALANRDDVRSLARIDAQGWRALLDQAHMRPPGGMSRDVYAILLARRVAAALPTDAWFAALFPQNLPQEVRRVLSLPAEEQARFTTRYPELGVQAILDDPQLDPAQKVEMIVQRLNLPVRVKQANPGVELLFVDYGPDSVELPKLQMQGLSTDERRMTLAALATYQRAYALGRDVAHGLRLIEAGYTSSSRVTADRFDVFARKTGLAASVARPIYDRAAANLALATAQVGSMIDAVRGDFDRIGVGNLDPALTDYLRRFDGFENLFGSQATCRCEHCQSILGPAAYFVDLMCFVRENVSSVDFTSGRADHFLHLHTRRPDLWALELSCRNTNERVPTLEIVNEVLESYTARRAGHAIPPTDRAAIETVVYEQLLGLQAPPGNPRSFRQPFVLPLERLETYLAHFEQTRAGIAQALDAPTVTRTAARLRLSALEYQLITQPDATLPSLVELYGFTFVVNAAGLVEPFEAHELLEPMGVTRDELGALLETRLVAAGASPAPEIRAEKRNADSVQKDVERVHHMSLDALDRLHRFTRLWRRTGWTVEEADLVLTHLGDTTLSTNGLDGVVGVLDVQERLGVSVEEACALWSDIPTLPAAAGAVPLFARLFNARPYVLPSDAFPQPQRFVHPSFRSATTPAISAVHARLVGGLRVGDEDLVRLIRALAGPLGADLASPNEDDRGVVLTVSNLSLLYRHARLAERLGLSLPQVFQLIAHAGLPGHVANADQLARLITLHAWWKTTSYTLDDLGFVTLGPVRDASAYRDPAAVAGLVIADAQASRSLVFADTVFAFAEGVTEEQSRHVVQANPTLIQAIPDGGGYWLTDAFTPTSSVTIPAGVPMTEPQARDLLSRYHASRVIPVRLAARLSVPVEKVAALVAVTGADLGTATFTRVLQGSEPPTALVNLVAAVLPLEVLFRAPAFDAAAIDFVRTHSARFGITDFATISMASVRELSVYARLADPRDAGFTTALPAVDASELRAVLAAFDPITKFAAADSAQLARVVRGEPNLVSTVAANVTLPDTAPEALDKLARATALARQLGVSGEAFSLILSDAYADLAAAAATVLNAFRAKYPDEKEWLDKVEAFEDRLRGRKRDALVDYLLHLPSAGPNQPELTTTSDLYHYFLIDVEVDGCARSSRVVAAISSVQLYVHRVLMNLEQDDLPPADPMHIHVPPHRIRAGEWAWRKNYRVWEANRKVFLYPENYLEPELRDDKTPLFKELEATLLEQEINERTVLDAYATYLRGFDEIAKLRIAGVYHDIRAESDVLHLLGVTPCDPPTYYYRTAENAFHGERTGERGVVWSPWKKVDVQIPVTRATPVVDRGRLHVFWVEYKTRPATVLEEGESEFIGYQHRMTLRFTTLQLDGTWTPPQEVRLPGGDDDGDPLGPSAGQIADELADRGVYFTPQHEYPRRPHVEPRDDYTLRDVNWEVVYLDPSDAQVAPRLGVTARNYRLYGHVDLHHRVLEARPQGDRPGSELGSDAFLAAFTETGPSLEEPYIYRLYAGYPVHWYPNRNAFADLILVDKRIERFEHEAAIVPVRDNLYGTALADLPFDTHLVSIAGSIRDALLQRKQDVVLLQGSVWDGAGYLLKRIGTTLSERLVERLFEHGVDALLDTDYQTGLGEAPLPFTITSGQVEDRSNAGRLDFTGPYGVYYREIFFHIPFLLANHLNSQGRFAAAQRWYHYIFNPTAPEVTTPPTDRNWRYIELRGLDVPKLRDLLTDEQAFEVYRNDPFNPHAIARLRLSAYQKAIVMKYIDNLLDWGDSLFSQFTMESVNEATLLYVLAADILGKRPIELGECGDGPVSPKTFEALEPLCEGPSELLVALETYAIGKRARRPRRAVRFAIDRGSIRDPASGSGGRFRGNAWKDTRIGTWTTIRPGSLAAADAAPVFDHDSPIVLDPAVIASFGDSLLGEISAVFCVPPNKELRAYWDRVEDRLFKIRNCMDITGARRELALFAPEIDPRLLVRMKAAGLTLEDVLHATTGDLPPYRFAYVIDKAKQYAATLQGYGAALLAALEKQDGEELSRLRLVHQQHLLKLTTRVREWEIEAAEAAIEALERQREAATYRRDYYQGLLGEGRSGAETAQSTSRHVASRLLEAAGVIDTTAGILYLLPQIGSPFAMKYGGLEKGNSANAGAMVLRDAASVAEARGASAGLEAGFHRRVQGWEHQRELAAQDLRTIEKQLEAARIRRDIAVRSLEIHQKTSEQTEEVFAFFGERFTNLGLYTFLSTTLQRLYREAYRGAYAMARLAEQAYRFERGDDAAPSLDPSYWDPARGGLLAGERLLVDLQAMERRFIETHYRTMEIDQSFSLLQIDPAALVRLRGTGTCEFALPELFFDLSYPGHYRRRIKAVRLKIPCITAEHTNVGATLTLIESRIRPSPALGTAHLVDVPPRRSVSIATSSAQADAGVFELSFRDERYMPFEGAGAVSRWRVSLPRSFRPFDYQTIKDVILSVSYTAEEDPLLRERIEEQNAAIEGTILHELAGRPLARLFSLREDFSAAFQRLLDDAAGTAVTVEITAQHLPFFLTGRPLAVERVVLGLLLAPGETPGAAAMSIDGTSLTGFTADPALPGLWTRELGTPGFIGAHTLSVIAPGDLAPPPDVAPSTLDGRKLLDVLLHVQFRVA